MKYETTRNTLIQLKDKMNESDWASISSLESDDHRYTIAINKAVELITLSDDSNETDSDLISRGSVLNLLEQLRIDNLSVNDKNIKEYVNELPTKGQKEL